MRSVPSPAVQEERSAVVGASQDEVGGQGLVRVLVHVLGVPLAQLAEARRQALHQPTI